MMKSDATSSSQHWSLIFNHPEFSLYQTADGSPTMAFGPADDRSEFMHSTYGAFTESVYNYGTSIQEAKARSWPVHILSLGLGLGYNEMIAAAMLPDAKTPVELTSFESVDFLRTNFLSWLHGELESPTWVSVYNQILGLSARHFKQAPEAIRERLWGWYKSGIWRLYGPLSLSSPHPRPYSVVIFDAFSKRTSPSLWTDDLLDHLLTDCCLPTCVFATYASTGNLKRCLKGQGFTLVPRKGHAGKRESTLALRTAE